MPSENARSYCRRKSGPVSHATAPRSRLPAAKIDFSLNATMQITVKPHFLDAAAHRTPMRA